MIKDRETIGKAIRKGLHKKEISQQDLAGIMNVGKSTISQWASGKVIPPGDKLLKLVYVLDIVPELFPDHYSSYDDKTKRIKKMENDLMLLQEKILLKTDDINKIWHFINPSNIEQNFATTDSRDTQGLVINLKQRLRDKERQLVEQARRINELEEILHTSQSITTSLSENLQILIVENDISSYNTIKEALLTLKVRLPIELAQNGAEAIEILERSKRETSMIILDLLMPKLNGIEFLEYIHNNPKYQQIPTIISTKLTDNETLTEVMKYGITGVMQKPFDFNKFSQLVTQIDLHWPVKKSIKLA